MIKGILIRSPVFEMTFQMVVNSSCFVHLKTEGINNLVKSLNEIKPLLEITFIVPVA